MGWNESMKVSEELDVRAAQNHQLHVRNRRYLKTKNSCPNQTSIWERKSYRDKNVYNYSTKYCNYFTVYMYNS